MRGVALPGLGSLVFFAVAPGTVAGWVPWRLTGWELRRPFFGWTGWRAAGAALVAAALAVLTDSFARFALEGRGTPAPPLPTERLVVSGWYGHVRNPMYVAVLAAIAGQALLFGSVRLLAYAGCVGLAFHAFVLLYEEPTLRARYGPQYDAYCAAVRRWWPRRSAWRADATAARGPAP